LHFVEHFAMRQFSLDYEIVGNIFSVRVDNGADFTKAEKMAQ